MEANRGSIVQQGVDGFVDRAGKNDARSRLDTDHLKKKTEKSIQKNFVILKLKKNNYYNNT
jgi:hypothetical protein